SAFNTTDAVTESMIRAQARKIGADIVLYFSSYMGAEQGVAAVLNYTPGETYVSRSSGMISGARYGTASYNGTITTTTPGTLTTSYVPVTRHRYLHDMTFWRKNS